MNKVAVFGMGLTELPMNQKLAEANIPIMDYDRSAEKLEPLKGQNVPTLFMG